jgi:aryl-alcohol dehydrogenase-like predicted oxidoreductase
MLLKALGNTSIRISAIGQGCMGIGGELAADSSRDAQQVDALRLGIDLGMSFIDTAEAYGSGHSEELVGKAIRGSRDRVFVATKVSPENLAYEAVVQAAERSLRRLGTDRIDLYQIHWPNPSLPIGETMRAMSRLLAEGKIRFVGVSNFSARELREAEAALGAPVVSNQVEYNLFDRFIEARILPQCAAEQRSLIAYSPLDKGRVPSGEGLLERIARRHGRTSAQVVLNWLVRRPQVVVIPKAGSPGHLHENAQALDFELSAEEDASIADAYRGSPQLVAAGEIRVSPEGEGNRRVYRTVDEARRNELGFSPSPQQLADGLLEGEPIKPVRLVQARSGAYKYDLVEGRIRYWAWVLAYGVERPIPSLIRSRLP